MYFYKILPEPTKLEVDGTFDSLIFLLNEEKERSLLLVVKII
jgi:hypothetical protein